MDINKTIEINCGTWKETNEKIKSVYIKTFSDAIHTCKGDLNALEELQRLVKVASWELDHLISDAYLNEHRVA